MTTLTLKPPSKPPRAAASYLLHELTENASARPQYNVARQARGLSGAPGRVQCQDVIEYMQDRKAFKSLLNFQILPPAGLKQISVQNGSFFAARFTLRGSYKENYNSLYYSTVEFLNLIDYFFLL